MHGVVPKFHRMLSGLVYRKALISSSTHASKGISTDDDQAGPGEGTGSEAPEVTDMEDARDALEAARSTPSSAGKCMARRERPALLPRLRRLWWLWWLPAGESRAVPLRPSSRSLCVSSSMLRFENCTSISGSAVSHAWPLLGRAFLDRACAGAVFDLLESRSSNSA